VWANDANVFIAQESDETQAYSVRVAGFDLLGVCMMILPRFSFVNSPQALIDRDAARTTKAFQSSIRQVLDSSLVEQSNGTKEWYV